MCSIWYLHAVLHSMPPYHIAITIDDNYIQHACVMLQSLNDNIATNVTVYCIYDTLSKDSQILLKRHFKNSNLTICFLKFNTALLPKLPIKLNDHVSAAAFFRIWLPQMLPRVKKVLFLDTDMVISSNIIRLLNLNIEGYAIAAIPDLGIGTEKKLRLGMDAGSLYFNSGVMVLNLHYFRQHNLTATLTHFISFKPELCEFWDQDALNAIINGQFLNLDYRYNIQTSFYAFPENEEVQQALQDPAIVHYTGGGSCKPWHYQNNHPLKHLYYKYLRKTPFRYSYPTNLPRSWYVFRKLKFIIYQTVLLALTQSSNLLSAIVTRLETR